MFECFWHMEAVAKKVAKKVARREADVVARRQVEVTQRCKTCC